MSKEGNEEGPQDKGAGGEALKKDSSADIYENRGSKKLVRLVTVLAYMFSVSFVAIVLSAYYLFLWEPPNPKLLRRPVHLSSEPEIQFLLSDPSIVSNQSNELEQTLVGRVVDDHGHVTKNRGNLNDSMVVLRNSLIEFLRNKSNDSKDRDPRRKSSGDPSFTEHASLVKEEGLNLAEKSSEGSARFVASLENNVESEMINKGIPSSRIKNEESTIDGNGTPSTLNSWTISGNEESSKNRLTDAINSTMYGSQDVYRSNRNLTKHLTVYREKRKKYIPTSPRAKVGTAITESGVKIEPKTVENASKYTTDVEVPESSKLNTFNGGFTSTVETTTIINKSDVIMTTRDKQDPETQRSKDSAVLGIEDRVKVIFSRRESRMQLPRKMSAQNVNPEKSNTDLTSVINTPGNREHKAASNEIRFAGDERKDKLYEPKHKQKLVRVLTVVAYVIFVSMGAILLSLYYTFLWDPKDVSVKPRAKLDCANTYIPNTLTIPSNVNETQIEKMTKSMSQGNERSPVPEIITTPRTTQRQKDLLTILTESTEIYSSLSPATTSELSQTNFSTTNSREILAKNRSESTS
ncbi:uncharacterized protein LOC122398935 [Colletes gigas]|uniref:uncharacterized protein LOC122398935 n=1 Tax=Colletes gigas TaxID=935657 RepID=UPI001C9B1E3C|nr:uncharacterized protein LOC122398935 [Colletes gigas]